MPTRRLVRLLVPLLLLAAVAPSAVLAARAWTIAASPLTVYVATETNVRLTVTNTGDNGGGSEITCVQIAVPASFTISDVKVVSVYGQTSGAAFDAWVAAWTGGSTVAFKNPGDDHALVGSSPPTDEAVFRITGSTNSLLAMTWTANAFDHSDGKATTTKCGSGSFPTQTLAFVEIGRAHV